MFLPTFRDRLNRSLLWPPEIRTQIFDGGTNPQLGLDISGESILFSL
jgi:hypothetical protein